MHYMTLKKKQNTLLEFACYLSLIIDSFNDAMFSLSITVASLTTRIRYMITHMKEHPKDLHSRRGLELMVQKRRKLLLYLRSRNLERYVVTLKALGLRPLTTPKSSKNR